MNKERIMNLGNVWLNGKDQERIPTEQVIQFSEPMQYNCSYLPFQCNLLQKSVTDLRQEKKVKQALKQLNGIEWQNCKNNNVF